MPTYCFTLPNVLSSIGDVSTGFENTKIYYEICPINLPICTVATVVKVICRYCVELHASRLILFHKCLIPGLNLN
jgi:hypothetical protein